MPRQKPASMPSKNAVGLLGHTQTHTEEFFGHARRRSGGLQGQTPPRDPLRQCIIKEVGFFAVERPVIP